MSGPALSFSLALDQDKKTCNNKKGQIKIIAATAKILKKFFDLNLYGTIDPGMVNNNISLAE